MCRYFPCFVFQDVVWNLFPFRNLICGRNQSSFFKHLLPKEDLEDDTVAVPQALSLTDLKGKRRGSGATKSVFFWILGGSSSGYNIKPRIQSLGVEKFEGERENVLRVVCCFKGFDSPIVQRFGSAGGVFFFKRSLVFSRPY